MADLGPLFDAFGGAGFDVVKWVNDALTAASHTPTVSEDNNISSLIARLQVLSQDTTDSVELCMSQLLGGIPRAERELGAVEAEIAALAHDFENVAKQASQLDDLPSDSADGKVQEDEAAKSRAETVSPSHARATAAYIEDLETLDRMKRNMEDTKTLLHEAAAWERLVRETDIVFEASDLGRVADHISMLQRSAAALADLPESGKRSEVLYSVNSRFEELVLPQLTAALASDNNDSLQRLVLVFTRMGQLKFVCTSFAKARVAPLLDLWRESFDDANFVEWMGGFYQDCFQILTREHRRVLRLFPGKPASFVTSTMLCEMWTTKDSESHDFSEQFRNRIRAHCTPRDVVQLYTVALGFAEQVSQVIPVQCFRRSALLAILQPYLWYRQQYYEAEKTYLLAFYSDLKLQASSSLQDSILSSEAGLPLLRECLVESISRCGQFTNYLELCDVRQAISVLIEEFVGHVRGIADAVKTVSVESAAGPADRPKPAAASDWLDVEEEPVRSSAGADAKAAASIDADVFTTALRLLGIADRLTRLLGDVEDRLRAGCSIAVDLLPTALVVASDWQSSLEDADSVFAGPSGAEVGSEVTDASEAANDASSLPLACAGVALTYDAAKVDALRRLASDGRVLLPSSSAMCAAFDKSTHQLLFDMMMAPIRVRFEGMPTIEAWCSYASDVASVAGDDDDLSYSIQPLPYITSVGEHLLLTIQLLEPIAKGEVQRTTPLLPDSFSSFGLDEWQSVATSLGLTRPYSRSDLELEAFSAFDASAHGHSSDVARAYSTLWLAAVVRGCVSLFLSRVLSVPALNTAAARQLHADFDYFSNVVAALGFSPDPVFSRIKDLLNTPLDLLLQAVSSGSGSGLPPTAIDASEDKRIINRLCSLRQAPPAPGP